MTTIATQNSGARSVASVKMGNPSLVFGRCLNKGVTSQSASHHAWFRPSRSGRVVGASTEHPNPTNETALKHDERPSVEQSYRPGPPRRGGGRDRAHRCRVVAPAPHQPRRVAGIMPKMLGRLRTADALQI